MKQTTIQELISEMEQLKETKLYTGSFKAIEDCLCLAYAKLEIEKQQIIDSFEQGDMVGRASIIREINPTDEIVLKYSEINAEQYFKKTFKQQEL